MYMNTAEERQSLNSFFTGIPRSLKRFFTQQNADGKRVVHAEYHKQDISGYPGRKTGIPEICASCVYPAADYYGQNRYYDFLQ